MSRESLSHNPTPTITLQSTIAEMIHIAVSEQQSKAIARFDFGDGREVAIVALVEDTNGYIRTLQAYEESRDEYANRVANAVAESIAEHGLPDPDNPQPFNLIKSSGMSGPGSAPEEG